jgi:hypothetical protein
VKDVLLIIAPYVSKIIFTMMINVNNVRMDVKRVIILLNVKLV